MEIGNSLQNTAFEIGTRRHFSASQYESRSPLAVTSRQNSSLHDSALLDVIPAQLATRQLVTFLDVTPRQVAPCHSSTAVQYRASHDISLLDVTTPHCSPLHCSASLQRKTEQVTSTLDVTSLQTIHHTPEHFTTHHYSTSPHDKSDQTGRTTHRHTSRHHSTPERSTPLHINTVHSTSRLDVSPALDVIALQATSFHDMPRRHHTTRHITPFHFTSRRHDTTIQSTSGHLTSHECGLLHTISFRVPPATGKYWNNLWTSFRGLHFISRAGASIPVSTYRWTIRSTGSPF